ncbi:MAG: HYR domain-containing protein, partial [Lewinella sp.]|nr:HYR domain-containing protein [Lewinella sp.]
MTINFRLPKAEVRHLPRLLTTLALLLGFSATLAAQAPKFEAKETSFRHPALEATFQAYEVYELDIVPLYEAIHGTSGFEFVLQLGGQHTWPLHLSPSNLLAPGYQELSTNEDGSLRVIGSGKAEAYEGYLNPKVDEHGYYQPAGEGAGLLPGEVRMSVHQDYLIGFVTIGQQRLFIEPLNYALAGAPANHYLVYDPNDVLQDPELTCGVNDMQKNRPILDDELPDLAEQAALGGGMCVEVELLTAATFDMVTKYGSVPAVNIHIQDITNMMQTYYSFAGINYVIVQQFTPATNGADPFTSSVVAGDLLNSIESWAGGGGIATHDIGQLWVNRDIVGCNGDDPDTNTSLIGCANIGVVCNSNRYNVNEDFQGGTISCLAVLSAHELGHNWDARHDDAGGNSSNIMFPSLNCGAPPTGFGGTSQAVILAHIASRGCLSGCGVPGNDLCVNANPLFCGRTDSGNTSTATATDAADACDGGGLPNAGVWYAFPGNGQIVTISTAGSGFDTQLNIYEGDCGALSCIGGDDDGGPGTTSEFTFCSQNDVIYYIYLDGFGAQTGNYFISLTCEPDTDPPSISCPSDDELVAPPGLCEVEYNVAMPTASDYCGVTVLRYRYRLVDENGNNIPGEDWSAWTTDATQTLAVGVWKIQWQAKDAAGNQNKCSYLVTVSDEEAPAFTKPANQNLSTEDGATCPSPASTDLVVDQNNPIATGGDPFTFTVHGLTFDGPTDYSDNCSSGEDLKLYVWAIDPDFDGNADAYQRTIRVRWRVIDEAGNQNTRNQRFTI